MTPLASEKKSLRNRMRALRAEVSQDLRRRAAEKLSDQLELLSPFLADARIIAGFSPIRDEIDPRPLMRRLEASGFLLALPRVEGDELVFHAFHFNDPLFPGYKNILEPLASRPLVTPSALLTPLLAFDARCERLGAGGGFYDRFLTKHPSLYGIGVCYAFQRVARIPKEPHDRPLDGVLTENGVWTRDSIA